jgi:hypothetical protein
LPTETPARPKSAPPEPTTSQTPAPIKPPAVSQTMIDSPGGMQAGRDINIGTDRQLSLSALSVLQTGFRGVPCAVTVGALGVGG